MRGWVKERKGVTHTIERGSERGGREIERERELRYPPTLPGARFLITVKRAHHSDIAPVTARVSVFAHNPKYTNTF